MTDNEITHAIIGGPIEVHKQLGPGLLECGHRIDLLVQSKTVVELKSVDGFAPIHEAIVIRSFVSRGISWAC